MPINIPDLTLDEGEITSGLCATPEDQAQFDEKQAGRPPEDDSTQP
jgi:hypothetical protein